MNRAVWSIAWKEYRSQRAFWISLLGLMLLVRVYLRLLNAPMEPETVLGFAFAGAVLYAIGSSATVFASEYDDETRQYLQVLPITPHYVAVAKVAWCLASTLCFFLTAWLLFNLMGTFAWPDARYAASAFSFWGLTILESVACGTFCSLVIRRPLIATCATFVAVALVMHLALWTIGDLLSSNWTIENYYHRENTARRLIAIAIICGLNLWLAGRWLNDARILQLFPIAPRYKAASHAVRWRSATVLTRLQWLSVRQSWSVLLIITAVGLTTALIAWWVSSTITAMLLFFVLLVTSALIGSATFLADHSGNSYRFLGDRGVSGVAFWLSRQLPVACLLGAIGLLVLLLMALYRLPVGDSPILRINPLFALLPGFAAGQFASMVLRSGLLAATLGSALALILAAWSMLVLRLQIAWTWTVIPLVLALLAASLTRAPRWLRDAGGMRGWAIPLSMALIPSVGVAITFIGFRVLEVPWTESGVDADRCARQITAEALKTGNMYREAYRIGWAGVEHQTGGQSLPEKANQAPIEAALRESPNTYEIRYPEAAIQIAVEASARPECALFNPQTADRYPGLSSMWMIGNLLLKSAESAMHEQDLSVAGDRYLSLLRMTSHLRSHSLYRARLVIEPLEAQAADGLARWAASKGQTVESLREMLSAIRAIHANVPPPEETIETEYLFVRRLLSGAPEEYARVLGVRGLANEFLWMRLPWERARAKRVLNQITHSALAQLRTAEEAIEHNKTPRPDSETAVPDHWSRSTPQLATLLDHYQHLGANVAHWYVTAETSRRGLELQLALQAWRMEHGSLPESLDDLTGAYFDQTPRDPFSGDSFRYFRKGVPRIFNFMHHFDFANQREIRIPVPPHTPFVLSQSGLAFPIW